MTGSMRQLEELLTARRTGWQQSAVYGQVRFERWLDMENPRGGQGNRPTRRNLSKRGLALPTLLGNLLVGIAALVRLRGGLDHEQHQAGGRSAERGIMMVV